MEEYVPALVEALEAAENHLRSLGFEPNSLTGAKGFTKTGLLRAAVDCLCKSDEAKRRFQIMARELFARMKTLILEPSVRQYYVRHDNIEAIYKKLEEKRDTADVTYVLKQIHLIVNDAIRIQDAGQDHANGIKVDLSKIDFAKLRDEFAKKVKCKYATLQDIRELVEKKLADMRADYYKKYQAIIADYNREKDRATVEQTFAKITDLLSGLDEESKRHIREGLSEDELALFDLLQKDGISKADRERVKQASKQLLAALQQQLATMPNWTQTEATRADVKICILDNIYMSLPRPPFTDADADALAERVYGFVWQRSSAGQSLVMAA